MNNNAIISCKTRHQELYKRITLKKLPLTNTIKSMKLKKTVRFCDDASLENVRLFLKTDTPKACRADPASQKKRVYSLRKSSWPASESSSVVRLNSIELADPSEPCLTGIVHVANLSYEKQIQVTFSFDNWHTIHSVDGSYLSPVPNTANTWDRFQFKIESDRRQFQTLQLAVKYTVQGQDYWDNNYEKNFQLDIIPEVQSVEELSSSDDSDSDEDTIRHPAPPIMPKLGPLSPTAPIDSNPLYYYHHQEFSAFMESFAFLDVSDDFKYQSPIQHSRKSMKVPPKPIRS